MPADTGFPAADVENDFQRARRRQVLARLAHRLRREPDDVNVILPFDEVVAALGMRGERRLGLQIIQLDTVVGTVDSTRDFDRRFRPTSGRVRERWERLALAERRGEPIPPIDVYRVGDMHFVQDGHHRVSIAMATSILVTLNGTIMSGARIPFAAARDKLFFKQMATIHPRFQSPSTSLVIQGLLATVLLLAVGRFQQLFELAIFAEWLFYMVTATTVFVYRRRLPNAVRPYRVWGYPILPALFVVAAGILLFYSYAENLKNSLIGTGIILLGIPLFGLLRRRRLAS